MPVLYIDVVWLINAAMDSFILMLTAWMARKPVRGWRILTGTILGASYSLLLFFPEWASWGYSLLIKFIFSVLMVYISFSPLSIIEFIRIFTLFYLASFVTGGAAFALNSFFQKGINTADHLMVLDGGIVWTASSKLIFVFAAVPLIYLLGKAAWNRLANARNREAHVWQVEVQTCGRTFSLTGLLDTGNSLIDPISRLPVAIADWHVFRSVLPDCLVQLYEQGKDPTIGLGNGEMAEDWQARLRIVPYRGVGGTTGMILAFRPERCVCKRQKESYFYEKVLVGLNPRELSAEGSYQMILHPSFLSESVESGGHGSRGMKGESIA